MANRIWKLGQQPEEKYSSNPAKPSERSLDRAEGRTKAAGFAIAAGGSAIGKDVNQRKDSKESPMLAMERRSSRIQPAESGTPQPKATRMKGEPK
jgi:hypothetical protein